MTYMVTYVSCQTKKLTNEFWLRSASCAGAIALTLRNQTDTVGTILGTLRKRSSCTI